MVAAAAAAAEDDGAEEEGRGGSSEPSLQCHGLRGVAIGGLYANGVAQQGSGKPRAAAGRRGGRRTPLAGAEGVTGPMAAAAAAAGRRGRRERPRRGRDVRGAGGARCGRDGIHAAVPGARGRCTIARAGEGARCLGRRGAPAVAHPSVIGLRQGLVVDGEGVPCTTVLEARGRTATPSTTSPRRTSDRRRAPVPPRRLARGACRATRGRCKDGLSADDLVPLPTLALVTGRSDGFGFEGFLLDDAARRRLQRRVVLRVHFRRRARFLHAVETPGAS